MDAYDDVADGRWIAFGDEPVTAILAEQFALTRSLVRDRAAARRG